MITFRGTLAAIALTGTVVATVPAAQAAERGVSVSDISRQAYPGESYSQYRRYYGGYGGGYYRRGYGGGAAAAGIAGLAAGALIGGAIASSQPAYGYGGPGAPVGNVYGHDPNWVAYCASRYRSFDPASGTFVGNDGNRYYCQ